MRQPQVEYWERRGLIVELVDGGEDVILPAASDCKDRFLIIKANGTGSTTISGATASDFPEGPLTISAAAPFYPCVTLYSDGTVWWLLTTL